jgi:CarD family transcriptional regulator
MFKTGDAIVHPVRGAGVVEQIEERQWQGGKNLYYRIKLLSQPASRLMIPIQNADIIGLRPAIPSSQLGRVWRALAKDPGYLPSDHKERYQILEDKLHCGDVIEVAEAVKDMAWRQQSEGGLTTRGKRIYEEGLLLLSGEIAATQGINLNEAEALIKTKLNEALCAAG